MKIEKHGAGGVAGVGDVHAAASQLPQQPCVDRAKCKAACFGELAGVRNVFENPGNFAAGEVSVDQQPSALLYQILVALSFELLAKRGGAAILPDNRVVDGLAGGAVPDNCGFALIGDADGGYLAGLCFGFGQGFQSNGDLRRCDLFGIVLDPSGLGKDLRELALGHGSHGALLVK